LNNFSLGGGYIPNNNNNNNNGYNNNNVYANLSHNNNQYEMILSGNSPLTSYNSYNPQNGNNSNSNFYNFNNNFVQINQTPNSMPNPKMGGNPGFSTPVSEFNSNINESPNMNFLPPQNNNFLNINGNNCSPIPTNLSYNQQNKPLSSQHLNGYNLNNNNNEKNNKRKASNNTADGKKEKEKVSNEKYTCKFEIQIENDNEFQVCRKIIGSKGCNMKNIVDICKNNTMHNVNEPVKLRLRGKGSGYKEGPDQKESDESLHLCVSSKYPELYYLACKLVEDLMVQLYDEYRKFTEKKSGMAVRLMIKKTEGDHTSVNYNMTKSFHNKSK